MKRRVRVALERRAHIAIGEGATALDYGLRWIEAGASIGALADSIREEMGEGSRPLVSSIMNRATPDATARVLGARARGRKARIVLALDRGVSQRAAGKEIGAELLKRAHDSFCAATPSG